MERDEEWVYFGCKNFFRVSKSGIVQSKLGRGGRFLKNKEGEWKNLKPSKGKTDNYGGYYMVVQVKMNDYDSHKAIRIHRLVASMFIKEIKKGEEVDHIDGNRENNSLSNLRIVSRKENATNAKQRGAFDKGQNSFKGKISKEILMEILKMIKNKEKNSVIARKFNVDSSNISNIKTGKWPGLKHLN